jgi:hypothetical protein
MSLHRHFQLRTQLMNIFLLVEIRSRPSTVDISRDGSTEARIRRQQHARRTSEGARSQIDGEIIKRSGRQSSELDRSRKYAIEFI